MEYNSYKTKRRIESIIKLISESSLSEFIKSYILNNTKSHGLVKLFKNSQLFELLKSNISYINDITLEENIYLIYRNILHPDNKCKINDCNNLTPFDSIKKGYNHYCSRKCQNKSPEQCKSISTALLKFHSTTNDNFYKERLVKSKKTNNIKYGCDFPIQNLEVQQKLKATLLEKYGVDHMFKTPESRLRSSIKYKELKQSEIDLILSKLNYSLIDSANKEELLIRCNHGHDFKISRKFFMSRSNSINGIPCTTCKTPDFKPERFIIDILKENSIEYKKNDRNLIKPLELDIVIENIKLCIEINGTYYHSEIFKDKKYHINKTNLVESQGYKLIQIWDDFILNKPDIVKSRILNLLGKSEKIYARKCSIKEVSFTEAVRFLEINHLQGRVNSKYNIGLYHENELVSLMTFGSLRSPLGQKSRLGHFELLRFCNKLNLTVIGGASKLFKHFVHKRNPLNVINYASRDWSNGNLYNSIGFNLIKTTEPGFYWIKNNERHYRFNFRKSVIANETNRDLSAVDIMYRDNYYRIFDSGHLKFEWKSSHVENSIDDI